MFRFALILLLMLLFDASFGGVWVYREEMALYDGPLEFYWSQYLPYLFVLLCLSITVFATLHQRSGRLLYKNLEIAFFILSLALVATEMILVTINSRALFPAVATILAGWLCLWLAKYG